MRRTGLLLLLLPLLASCGAAHGAASVVPGGEKRYRQTSPAMEPTVPQDSSVTAKVIKPGDYVPTDGDIVVFNPPPGWNSANATAPRMYRVVAIPGESIACCDKNGRIERNNKPVDEPYVAAGNNSDPFDTVKIPPNQLFLLGDNRPSSADSRIHGLIPTTAVIGIVKMS